jgi:HK97 family phage major capsid protein
MAKTITQINELKAKRAAAIGNARKLLDTAEARTASPNLTADEQTQYDGFMNESRTLKTSIEREEQLQREEGETSGDRSPNRPDQRSSDRDTDEDSDEEGSEILTEVPPELRALLGTALLPQTRKASANFPEAHRRAAFRALLDGSRGKKDYRKAYGAFLRSGRASPGLQEATESRAMQADSDTGGGYMLSPATMVAELIKTLDNAVIVRQYAKKFSTGHQGLGAVSLDTDLTDFNWTTELLTGDEDEVALGKRELKPHPMAKKVLISKTLARNAPDIVTLVNERLAYILGVTQEKAYLTGNGAGQPLGVFTASNNGIPTSRDISTGNTATAMTVDGLKAAKWSLKSEHRRKARWMFHRDGVAMIDKLKDGNGQYLWQPSVQVGQPDRFLNLPVDESEYAPNTFTSGQYVGLLANWDYYWILDSLDLAIQVLLELYAATNKNGYHARYEGDGMPVLAEAFARVKLG